MTASRPSIAVDLPLRTRIGRAPFPYTPSQPLPQTLPSGKPWPSISIITPTRNQADYLEETILSVQAQLYPNLEHIIIDGGSTDHTHAILDRYRPLLTHCISEPDEGQSHAINKGMALATGHILTWLNSDDMLAPNALAAAAIAFDLHDCDMIAGECHVLTHNQPTRRHLTAAPSGPLQLRELLDLEKAWLAGRFFYQPEVFFTRDLWLRAGGHVDQRCHYSMDYELWLRFAKAGARLHVLGTPLALFRAHDAQKTASTAAGGFRAELPIVRDRCLAEHHITPQPPLRTPIRRTLTIALLNDLGFSFGAGIAHARIAEALALLGHTVVPLATAAVDEWWNAPGTTSADVLHAIERTHADLVVLGNLHGVDLHPSLLHAIADRWPTAVVLHDLWWLTGRCAYPGPCTQWQTGCNESCTCPGTYPRAEPHERAPLWRAKRDALNHPNVHLWPNSHWTATQARQALAHDRIHPVRLAVDTARFRPRDRAACREALNLPQDRLLILTSATTTDDPRKGGHHLAEALRHLRLPDTTLLALGENRPHATITNIPNPIHHLGYITDPDRLAMLYSAADLFVGPSLDEAFGQVFIEAAACGTPSIAHNLGGVPEALVHDISGLLTREPTAHALAESIAALALDAARRAALSRTARLFAEQAASITTSAHSINTALHATGLAESLGLSHNITLNPTPVAQPRLIKPTWPSWHPIQGIEPWDGPYPEHNLPRFRWFLAPAATFDIHADHQGPAKLVLLARILGTTQRLRLIHGHNNHTELDLHQPEPSLKHEHTIAFDVMAKPGWNRYTLESWSFDRGPRPLALAVTAVALFPKSSHASLCALGASVVK